MNRPSLFSWLSRWAIGSLACLALLALALIVINAIDYAPYGLALRRAHKLSAAELEALAAACTRYEQHGHQRLFGDEIPKEFRALKPVRVSIYPGCTDISLLEREYERYIFLRISTSAENQIIKRVSYSGDCQRSLTLWERNPQFTRALNPLGRIVTVSQSNMSSAREWIVQPNRLLVVDRNCTAGGSDQVIAERPLDATQREAIEDAVHAIGPEVRGHAFDAGAADGVVLSISFSSDGAPDEGTDIMLANVWRTELEQVVQLISQIAGRDHEIGFPDIVRRLGISQRHPPIVLPLDEYNRRLFQIRLPWWCWWPRLGMMAESSGSGS